MTSLPPAHRHSARSIESAARCRPHWLLLLAGVLGAAGCARGGTELPTRPGGGGDGGASAAGYGDAGQAGRSGGGSGAEDEGPAPPSEVALTLESEVYGPDKYGFEGHVTGTAATDSEVEVHIDDGGVCLRGETGQVLDSDYTTHWGAEATFNLCETEDGDAAPVSECLSAAALRDFVGLKFTLEGSRMPWLVVIRFNETGRESPASVWTQSDGDTTVFFQNTTNPFDSSAGPVTPSALESLTVRAAGDTEGTQSFDFCMTDISALFGEEWLEEQIPDWLDEEGTGQQVDYVGANLVGAEFGEGNLPGEYGSDYIYPDAADIEYYATKGMNIFRVPFRWERLQRKLNGRLDETELGRLKEVVSAAREQGATVIIDPHNFARYDLDTSDNVEELIDTKIEIEAFADFWGKVAHEFANDDLVWFGLMNEPHDMETETWLEAANAALAAIRDADANNFVLVPGNQWTGAHAWFDDYYGTPNSEVLLGVVDPIDNFAIEVHQYFDSGSSGTENTCVSEAIGVSRVEGVTTWLEDNGLQGFLGEFGGSTDPVCLGAMDQLLTHLGEHSDAWLGWAIWASSQWTLQLNIRPLSDGTDSLQMRVLLRHMDKE